MYIFLLEFHQVGVTFLNISNTTIQDFYRNKHIDCLAYIEGFIFIKKATTGLDNLQKTAAARYH